MNVTWKEKLSALQTAVTYRPILVASIVTLNLFGALLEGVGIGFILPIIEFTRSSSPSTETGGLLSFFVRTYETAGIPFTLEYLLLGVAVVMAMRFGADFCVGWLQSVITSGYQCELRRQLFDAVSEAPVEYIDSEGSDALLNEMVTETNRAGGIVYYLVNLIETLLRGAVYLVVAAVLSIELTVLAILGLGVSTGLIRFVLTPAYTVGDEVVDANSSIQRVSQIVIQGARDVRLFALQDELAERLHNAQEHFFNARVRLMRNESALSSLNQLTNAFIVFGLIYVGIRFTTLSIGEIGVFLFAVYRLSPALVDLNSVLYSLDGDLPQLVRVRRRIEELGSMDHPISGTAGIDSVSRITFEDVSFSYDDTTAVLRDISFEAERGEFVSIVGQSGAGKSTMVSLLTRFRTPDSGRILADGTPIKTFALKEWRDRLAVVRQNPYIFTGTLRENVTLGNRSASQREVDRICSVAQVTEFLPSLPDGYETELGDDGVRLSGGQRQRVAIARALLTDADILVLDEAMSELDSTIERTVHANIREMSESYAIISIAHRQPSMVEADRIYTLVDGSVAEVGTHRELLDKQGVYADLYTDSS